METGSGSNRMSGGMRTEQMKKTAIAVLLLAGLAACNTIEGFGQDVSAGARAVDRAL